MSDIEITTVRLLIRRGNAYVAQCIETAIYADIRDKPELADAYRKQAMGVEGFLDEIRALERIMSDASESSDDGQGYRNNPNVPDPQAHDPRPTPGRESAGTNDPDADGNQENASLVL